MSSNLSFSRVRSDVRHSMDREIRNRIFQIYFLISHRLIQICGSQLKVYLSLYANTDRTSGAIWQLVQSLLVFAQSDKWNFDCAHRICFNRCEMRKYIWKILFLSKILMQFSLSLKCLTSRLAHEKLKLMSRSQSKLHITLCLICHQQDYQTNRCNIFF